MKTGSIENMLKDFNDGTYNLTCNGICTGCGECCSNLLPMTDREKKIIENYIKKNKIKPNTMVVAPIKTPVLDMTCPFLDNRKTCDKCTIYEVRPKVCRDFICDPKQRQKIDIKYVVQCKIVDLRKEFFCKGKEKG